MLHIVLIVISNHYFSVCFRLKSILSRFDEVLNSGNMALSLSQGKLTLSLFATLVCIGFSYNANISLCQCL